MSSIFRLNWKDLVKGLIIAVLSSVLAVGIQDLQTGTVDYKAILTVALSSCMAYLLKQLATDSDGKLLGGKF